MLCAECLCGPGCHRKTDKPRSAQKEVPFFPSHIHCLKDTRPFYLFYSKETDAKLAHFSSTFSNLNCQSLNRQRDSPPPLYPQVCLMLSSNSSGELWPHRSLFLTLRSQSGKWGPCWMMAELHKSGPLLENHSQIQTKQVG